jgi:hypothetical protein
LLILRRQDTLVQKTGNFDSWKAEIDPCEQGPSSRQADCPALTLSSTSALKSKTDNLEGLLGQHFHFIKASDYEYPRGCVNPERVEILKIDGAGEMAEVRWSSGFTYWVKTQDLVKDICRVERYRGLLSKLMVPDYSATQRYRIDVLDAGMEEFNGMYIQDGDEVARYRKVGGKQTLHREDRKWLLCENYQGACYQAFSARPIPPERGWKVVVIQRDKDVVENGKGPPPCLKLQVQGPEPAIAQSRHTIQRAPTRLQEWRNEETLSILEKPRSSPKAYVPKTTKMPPWFSAP